MGERIGEHLQASGNQLLSHLDETEASGIIGAFGRELAERIKGGVGPEGYALAVEQLHADVATGVNSLTDEPLSRTLTEIPPMMRGVLRVGAQRLITEVFGDAFARAVDDIYDQRLPQLEAQARAGA